MFLILHWSTGAAEYLKEVSLSYKSTNRCKHSTNKGTNRMRNVSKLQVTNARLNYILNENMTIIVK